ncbi:penicillin acylase family protein [Gaoshiqia sp. Z1-71]|uniref:penicillin acylase family protein n=1 Tax=Gaoshiqia hydrogeniformans TaxID=3290090 RepID=UPI003BF8AC4E
MTISNHLRIERDEWGMPHIWGKTDADAAYGLSWARAEDNFEGLQEAFMVIRERQAEMTGYKGIGSDVLVFLIRADELLNDQWEQSVSSDFKKVLSAGVKGLNDYAKQHPAAVKYKRLFPVSEQDVLKGYILTQTFTSGAIYALAKVAGNKMEKLPEGSNAFAFSRKRMEDDKTLLVSNVHQPISGPWAFYEAHLCSDEGWNILGATYSPGVTPLFGASPYLAWSPTNNYANFADTYQLQIHPDDPVQYLLDGSLERLKPLTFKTKMKLGPFAFPIRKKYFQSQFGITVNNKSGCFALRFPARFCIKAAEQFYRMGKAKNLQEFKHALSMQGLASQNLIYADREDHLFFISNGLFPYRNPEFNDLKILPGNTSRGLWEPVFHPLEDLPQLENPDCGYIYNTNNPPFFATAEAENLKPEQFDPSFGFIELESNRGLRFKEIMKHADNRKISYAEVKAWKYDRQFTRDRLYTFSIENIDELLDTCFSDYPDLRKSISVIRRWNRKADPENKQASLMAVLLYHLVVYIDDHFLRGQANRIPEKVFADSLRKSQKHLLHYFGNLEIPLGRLQFLVRGKTRIPVPGLPENLAATFLEKDKKGTFRMEGGDSYIQFVRFSEARTEIESIVPYGASECANSPHYADQMPLFAAGKLKKADLYFFEKSKHHAHPRSKTGR